MQVKPYLLLVLLLVYAYVLTDENYEIHGATLVDKAPYEQIYRYMEKCVGLEGDFSKIQVFLVDSMFTDGQSNAGLWFRNHSIYVKKRYEKDQGTFAHEFGHDIRGWRNTFSEHPRDIYPRCAPRETLQR